MGKQHRYALTARQLFFACWRRENLLVSRNMFQYGFRFFITVVMVRHVSRNINRLPFHLGSSSMNHGPITQLHSLLDWL